MSNGETLIEGSSTGINGMSFNNFVDRDRESYAATLRKLNGEEAKKKLSFWKKVGLFFRGGSSGSQGGNNGSR